MGQKTKFGFVFCAAAGLIASAGLSYADAQAQQGDVEPISVPEPEASADPVFISDEVVQPLPEPEETPAVVEAVVPDADSLSELMANVDAPQTLSDQLECLAGAIYFESRGEPIEGQLAVAQVIINRAESTVFPSDYCGVVTQRSQFSFVKNGRIPTNRSNAAAWERARKIARIAHEGMWDSEAGDSLYFHATYVRPSWARKKVARATIKTHIFYR
ncbi:cell wall hydrolase [Citromicrobium bathyomarinum]|jgi:spore germination cell wall hydrolase CwlJ-like protein|uniref:cell wall hydrolase n=1 Tax=Sphingomonadales TaxID=204457 RepID=UPI000C3BD83A|nr:cell wall hydrolase [Citromicrobium sp.]MBO80814.1 cell wall hydrolase [Citromicrobium sp.]|tara:strand:- start:397 stop:1044 length:648 start_codon:yes stop_codon:yes gene_type:complete